MKLCMPWIIVIFSVLILTVCQKKENMVRDVSSLLQTDRDFSQMSVEKGAAEAFKFYLCRDAIQLPDGGHPITGRETIYKRMKKNEGTYELEWEPQKAEVCKSGEMGYTWGVYTTTYFSNGEKKISFGKYLNIWKKQPDNSWKVLIDMGNSSPGPEPSITDED